MELTGAVHAFQHPETGATQFLATVYVYIHIYIYIQKINIQKICMYVYVYMYSYIHKYTYIYIHRHEAPGPAGGTEPGDMIDVHEPQECLLFSLRLRA